MSVESSAVLRSCRSHCIQHNDPLPQLGILQWVIFNPFYIWGFYSLWKMMFIKSFFRVFQSQTLGNSTKRIVGAAMLTFPKAYTLWIRCIHDTGCLDLTTETLRKTGQLILILSWNSLKLELFQSALALFMLDFLCICRAAATQSLLEQLHLLVYSPVTLSYLCTMIIDQASQHNTWLLHQILQLRLK